MALDEGQISKAKDDARELLEYSIYVLSLILAVDVGELDSNFVNPVSEDDPTFYAYECLRKQAISLERLG